MNVIIADRSGDDWKQQQPSQKPKSDAANSNRQWSLHRLQLYKPNTKNAFPRSSLKTTVIPTAATSLTNTNAQPNVNKKEIDENHTIPPHVLLNSLHRESSI